MPPDEQPIPRRRALLVATAQYDDPALAALRAPTGDVAALAAVLGDAEIGGFDVQQLVDQPTEELRKQIEMFFDEGRPHDLLLLYVSGHGVLSQSRRFYFATANTSLQLLRSTAIEDSFVNDVMQGSRARSIVLVLDCCHSGAFGKGLAPKSATTVDVEHRFEGQGRVTLSASTELEYAFEETEVNELDPAAPGSLFTRSIVEGLSSGDADLDEDGRISVDDLYDYVCRRVRERSVHQTPGMAGDLRGDITIAHSRRGAVLPPDLQRAVASSMPGIRSGAVSELATLLKAEGAVSTAAHAALERLERDDSHAVAAAAAAALGRPAPPEPSPPKPPSAPPSRRRIAVRAGVALAAIALVVLAVVVVMPGGGDDGSSGPSEATPYDFNGLGYQDVVAAPLDAGKPAVFIASTQPDVAPRPISAAEAGVAGDDTFGTAVAGGDFDGDSKADIAIGAPGSNIVSVLYGDGAGGFGRKAQIKGDGTTQFGAALVARDLNDDHHTDLVVGAAGAGKQAGQIEIFHGGAKLLARPSAQRLDPPATVTDSFGALLQTGDLNGDGRVDLVEGAPSGPGHLTYCLQLPSRQFGGCEVLDNGDENETNALAVGDLDNDDKDDIVQGDAHIGQDSKAGGLRVWFGGESGPQGTPRNFGPGDITAEKALAAPDSGFGTVLDAGDIDGDEFADVVIGAPGYDNGRGSGFFLRGASRADLPAPGLNPLLDEGDRFGSAVSLLFVNSSDTPTVVVASASAALSDAVHYVENETQLQPVTFGQDVPTSATSPNLRLGQNAGAD